MEGSVYKIIEIVGTSTKSWEDATKVAVETASKSLEDLRIAEIVKQDVTIEKGKVASFRVRLAMSFKYHPGQE
jgi:flavin-binding protein dodecin